MNEPSIGLFADKVVGFPGARVDDEVDATGFIFHGDEGDAFGCTGALTQYDQASDANELSMIQGS